MHNNRKLKGVIGRIVLFLFVVILTLIVLILDDRYPFISEFLDRYIFPVIMVIIFLILIYSLFILFYKKVFCPRKLQKVLPEDIALIKEFDRIHMTDVPCELDDYVEDISFLCMDFIEMKKKTFSKDFFDYDYLLEEIDGKAELLYFYDKGRKVIDIIYKYYDDKGNRMI